MEIGTGSQAESTALRSALSGLSDEALSRLRVSSDVPGRRTELIQVVTRTTQQNASIAWGKLKEGGFLNTSGACVETYRFPGQRGGRPSEVVDIPTALQIIMALPGKTAATVRLRASVLLVRFLAGLREHHPEHPLREFRAALEAGQTTPLAGDGDAALERQAKRARLLREIAANEEAAALSNERTARAKDIVSMDIAERGISSYNQIQSMAEGMDDRERVALRARVTTSLLGVEQPQPARCEIIVENFLREQRSSVNSSVFGRKAAAIWRELHPNEQHPTKRIVLSNGQATNVNIYYQDEIDTVLLPALQQCERTTAAAAPPPPVDGDGDLRRHFRPAAP
jgi:hypothetical protein